jgi:selenium metabolism protein YedF
MARVTLDCTGLPCPQPVLRTKETLEQGVVLFDVLVDNEASGNNVVRYAQNQGCQVEVTALPQGHCRITLAVVANQTTNRPDQHKNRCEISEKLRLVYVISSDSMGRGDDELGWALLQTYIQTIKDIQPLPEKIIFYNSGVKQVTNESGALEALKHLQAQGVEILACGTCLDFFRLKSAIKVGQISNMYDIMSSMTRADKIVSPY